MTTPYHPAVMSSDAFCINAQFARQAEGKYLVKTKGGAVFEFLAADFKSAMEQLVTEVSLLKKVRALPEDFNIATQVKIDVGW
ncbi:MAG: hypothetical protein ICV83_08045 [Cytophagales bacterium]|nr:hypothetical protein [Cytophagales bacterium]